MNKEKQRVGLVVWPMLLLGAGAAAVAALTKSGGPALFGWLLDVGTNVGLPGVAGSAGAAGAGQCPPGTESVNLPPGIPWPTSNLGCPVDPDTGGIAHDHPAVTPGGPVCLPDGTNYHPQTDSSTGGGGSSQPDAPEQSWSDWFDEKAKEAMEKVMDHRNY